jgi:hypothetical protein
LLENYFKLTKKKTLIWANSLIVPK